jgi:hypothetical protein
VLDPSYVEHVERSQHLNINWVLCRCKDILPPDMPEPLGKPVQVTGFLDSDHVSDQVTRRSQTGILIFLNCVLLLFGFLEDRIMIETSSFGSEFAAMKQGVEVIDSKD